MKQRAVRNFADTNAQPFLLKGGPHGVLLLHGFTGSAAHMRLIGVELNRQGFTVQGIHLPGHATTMEEMAKTGWQDWLRAAKEVYLSLQDACETVCVAGLSMGGVLSLILAEQMPVKAVVTISAPMPMKNRFASLSRLTAPFRPIMYWKGSEEREKLLNQEYDYGYLGFPTARAAELLHLIRLARANLFSVTCPVLAVQSHADETIHEQSAQIILQGVKSAKKAMLWLEDVPHVCTISTEYLHIAETMAAFFSEALNA